jgi:branched-chain amino acid transport system ATP-binding protein
MTLLEIDNVESGYGDLTIVDGASLRLSQGEIGTIIGPNGAGKSTLLKTVVGLLKTRSGYINFDDKDITNINPTEMNDLGICYVPQDDNIFPSLSVRENLIVTGQQITDDFDARVEEVYERFPILRDREEQMARTMSGGQRQMLALGTAFMLDPDLLILDEPSAGLSPSIVDDIFAKIHQVNDSGTTVLMVEQNARRALSISDRGYVLVQGRTEFEGTASNVLQSDEIADMYLGSVD